VVLELHQGLLQRGLSYFTPKKRYDVIIFADRAVKVTSLPHALSSYFIEKELQSIYEKKVQIKQESVS